MISLELVLRQVTELNALADVVRQAGRNSGFHNQKGFYQDPNSGLPREHWISEEEFDKLMEEKG